MNNATYGDKIKRLEEIVAVLESGDASLEESLKLFEEAGGLVSDCNSVLTEVRLKISQMTFAEGENND